MARNKTRAMVFSGYDARGQFRHALECMEQGGAVGEAILINLNGGCLTAQPAKLESLDNRLPENTIAVLIDGGDRDTGEMWKTWYLPHAHQACVLVEATGQNALWGMTAKPPKGAVAILYGADAKQAMTNALAFAREGGVLSLRRNHDLQRLEAEPKTLNPEQVEETVEAVIATGCREGDGQIIVLWHPQKETGFEVAMPDDAEVYDAADQNENYDQRTAEDKE